MTSFLRLVFVFLLLVSPAWSQSIITTVAGTDFIFPRTVRAADAPLDGPTCVGADAQGNVYVCDGKNHIVARVSRAGVLTIAAGNGIRAGGYSGDGGPAVSASLNYPQGVAIDFAGNLYIADTNNQRVRKVTPDGFISTYAGTGQRGFSGDAGPATRAQLSSPARLAVDSSGALYIADMENMRVRRVATDGTISTFAGNGQASTSGDGGPAVNASIYRPAGIGLDAAGNAYISENTGGRIRKVTPQGVITTLASLTYPGGVDVDASGNVYVALDTRNQVSRIDPGGTVTVAAGGGTVFGDDGPATMATLGKPNDVAVDLAGNLYITDFDNHRLRRVSALGIISTFAGSGESTLSGDGGPALAATFNRPSAMARDGAGNIYVADYNNDRVRKIDTLGMVTTYAGGGMVVGDGGPATKANIGRPAGLALDAAGNLYVSDQGNCRVRKVTPLGIIITFAGAGCWFSGGDGGPAAAANLNDPAGLAFDRSGNLLIAESGFFGGGVRQVATNGTISTIVSFGSFGYPADVKVDSGNTVYIAVTGAHTVQKLGADGKPVVVAGSKAGYGGDGGQATAALLNTPTGLFFTSAGYLYIADSKNHRVRRIDASGVITSIVGSGTAAFTGDGMSPLSASLNEPHAVLVQADGSIYVADTGNNRIRAIPARPATFTVRPARLDFSAAAGSAATALQLGLVSSVPGLAWQTTGVFTDDGRAWLSVSANAGAMPAILTVTANPAGLATGSYQGTIEISAPAAVPSTVTIPVTLTLTGGQPPGLSVQPTSMHFSMLAGGTAPAPQAIQIDNTGSGTLSWTAEARTAGGNWLSLSATAGNAPAGVRVSVNPAGLATGSYSGKVTVSSGTTNQSVTVPVNLLISAGSVVSLLLSQTSLVFQAVEGGGAEPPQIFGVLNTGGGTLDWSAQASDGWISISPSSGRSDAATRQIPLITVSVDPTGLSTGFYIGLVRVTAGAANNSPQVVRVGMQVLPRSTKLGSLVRPTGLIFVSVAGSGDPSTQEVSVGTPETSPIQFVSQPIGGAWMTRTPDSGSAARDNPGRILVQPKPGGMAAGAYRAGLTVLTSNDGELHPVNVLLLVLPAGATISSAQLPGQVADLGFSASDLGLPISAATCNPSTVYVQFTTVFARFNAVAGWPSTIRVEARDDCGNPAVGGTTVVGFSNGDPALALVDLKNGQYQGAWSPGGSGAQVVLTARTLWSGLQGQATATALVATNPITNAILLNQGGVLLGAGFERGPVAPGSIISLFGQNLTTSAAVAQTLPLPRTLNGVRVLVGEKEAPLFYVGPSQVNAQVPFELESDRQLQVRIEVNGVSSAPEPLQTSAARPGIFTLGPPYGNQGAILIANSNKLAMPVTAGVPGEPTQAGGVISIFCTGLGATDPAVASGQPGPSAEPLAQVKTLPTVTIGGLPATVSFAGLAPGFAAVYQVNAQVPAGVAAGDAVPVVITQGGASSNTATIAVR
jgi:uncharacterized protein (TIGR03437 family)